MHRRLMVLGLVLALLTAACGDDDGDGNANGNADSPTTAAGPAEVATDKGVTDDEIRVGFLNGFTGPIAPLAIAAGAGFDAAVHEVNEAGGICGREVVTVRGDTKYDPQVSVQEYRANKDDVVMLGSLTGTAALFGLSEDIARDGITVLGATGSASVLPLENIWLYITSFTHQALNAISWAAEEEAGDDGALQLGILYQDDPFGQEGLAAAQFAEANLDNVEIVGEAKYAAGDQDFTAQAQALKDSGAEVVWLHAIPSAVTPFLGAAAQIGYEAIFIGIDASWSATMVEPLGDILDNYRVVTSSVAWGEDVAGMDELLAAYEAVSSDPGNDFVIAGYINGRVAMAALRRACELGDLTQAGIGKAMVGLEVDNGGLGPKLSFGDTLDEQIPSRATRVNAINLEEKRAEPLTDFAASPLAEQWTFDELPG
ncbi:MAG: ABC transporter substrate-binding protein [Acidimicrobiia bacterium]|nr:ABC transporter substrate-binding protein [Acidimicrobiia bacterium]